MFPLSRFLSREISVEYRPALLFRTYHLPVLRKSGSNKNERRILSCSQSIYACYCFVPDGNGSSGKMGRSEQSAARLRRASKLCPSLSLRPRISSVAPVVKSCSKWVSVRSIFRNRRGTIWAHSGLVHWANLRRRIIFPHGIWDREVFRLRRRESVWISPPP